MPRLEPLTSTCLTLRIAQPTAGCSATLSATNATKVPTVRNGLRVWEVARSSANSTLTPSAASISSMSIIGHADRVR